MKKINVKFVDRPAPAQAFDTLIRVLSEAFLESEKKADAATSTNKSKASSL